MASICSEERLTNVTGSFASASWIIGIGDPASGTKRQGAMQEIRWTAQAIFLKRTLDSLIALARFFGVSCAVPAVITSHDDPFPLITFGHHANIPRIRPESVFWTAHSRPSVLGRQGFELGIVLKKLRDMTFCHRRSPLRFSAVDFESPSQPPDQSARHYGGLPFPLTGLRDLSSWLASSCQQKSSSLECVDATR